MSDRPLTFDPGFAKLGREIERFANHTDRFVRASQKHRALLERASAWSQGAAPLDQSPPNVAEAMRAIDEFARTHRADQATLFGAYFAHHHLRQQAEISRELLRSSFRTDPAQRILTAIDINESSHIMRRTWVSALIERSIASAAPDLHEDDYAAFNVGALTDHEDVDIAFVVASDDARKKFAKGFAAVSKVFLRYASKIQIFLADQLPQAAAGNTIEEYEQIVREHGSVVVPLQLLGAQHLAGSKTLARLFTERITQRYYAQSGQPLAHEAFLRDVMAELRHYHNLDRIGDVLAPKREVYMPAKLVVAALRTVHGVHEARPSLALGLLAERNPGRRNTYLTLRDAFVQNEVLRALLFLYVARSGEVDLFDPIMLRASRRVALLLGLGESARRTAETRLLAYFKDIRARALGSIFELSFDISRHLRKVSTFRALLDRGSKLSDTDTNLAQVLLQALKRFKSGVFWDEVVELLATNRELFARFITDINALEEEPRKQVAREYVEMMCADAASLIEFLIFLSAHDRESSDDDTQPNARLFWDAMMDVLRTDQDRRDRFVQRLDDETETEALFRLANTHPPDRVANLAKLIERLDQGSVAERVVRSLRSVIILAHHHSNALGRTATRVLGRTPEFVQRLGDFERLRALSRDLLTQAAREPNPNEQIELLGDGFDVENLRMALVAVLEGAPADRDEDYVRAFDDYVRELFKTCFREVRERSSLLSSYRPTEGFGLFAAGSLGRGEAFAADWDYIAVVAEDDGARKKFLGKIMQRVEGAMVRRGMIPHNRLTDAFNSYVVSIPELHAFLQNRTPETFIDEAEVMEARFMLGDPLVSRLFEEKVRGAVRGRADLFVQDLIREIWDNRRSPPVGLNTKQGPGGLREIQLLWMILHALSEEPGPVTPASIGGYPKFLPAHRADLRFLMIANAELRRIRDLYRLVIAIDEPMSPEALVEVARDLTPLRNIGARDDFAQEIEKLMAASMMRVDRVARSLAAHLGFRASQPPLTWKE